MTLKLTKEQANICYDVVNWYRNGSSQYITVGGYAGTGKTTLVPHIIEQIRGTGWSNIAFAAFTGKASFVMKTKLEECGIVRDEDFTGTLHSLMYVPLMKEAVINGRKTMVVCGWRRRESLDYELIVIDEASMVNRELWSDVLSYGIPILAIGDHGQLPPIGGNFNLMQKPKMMLKNIHRQALESPIIKVSQIVRQRGIIEVPYPRSLSDPVFGMNWRDPKCRAVFQRIDFNQDIMCLCGFNSTRVKINKMIREMQGNKLPEPYTGEKLVCLRNNHNSGVMNGQIGTMKWGLPAGIDLMTATIQMDGMGDKPYLTMLHMGCFGKENYEDVLELNLKRQYAHEMREYGYTEIDLFDYGYAITVHKSQGSEWDKVILFVQRNKHQSDEEYRRWLYTAVTRAREKLFVIYSFW